jgi:hypothetical protein
MRTALAILATAAVLAGCGAGSESDAGEEGVDAPGVLVFSGLSAGSYLHAIRPNGTGLAGVELPNDCSPWDFSRDGRVIRCYDLSAQDSGEGHAWERRGAAWERVALPPEWKFPEWLTNDEDFFVAAPRWAPTHDRIALIRRPDSPYGDIWFSAPGNVVVVGANGGDERVVAEEGEVPTWSPDGKRLAFARCRVLEGEPTDENAADSAECSAWVVPADGGEDPRKLADDVDSAPIWSPDGRHIAFFRAVRPCSVNRIVCKRRIFVVPTEGGEPRPVGPELIEASQLFWRPELSAIEGRRADKDADDSPELQRCVDIWNRAQMEWPSVVANVRLVKEGCEITVAGIRTEGLVSVGFPCLQPVPYSFQCPGHGERLKYMDPAQRVWNAQADERGKLRLVRAPKGARLPLPKAPPYPILDGYILPFDSDGNVRKGLTISEAQTGTCIGRGFVDHPDSVDCGWRDGGFSYIDHHCFKPPGPLEVGDIVLCSEGAGETSFIQLKLSKVDEPLD